MDPRSRRRDPWDTAWRVLLVLLGVWVAAMLPIVFLGLWVALPPAVQAVLLVPGALVMLLRAVAFWAACSTSRTGSTRR